MPMELYQITLYPEGTVATLKYAEILQPGQWLLNQDDPEDQRRWWQLETIDHDTKTATARLIDPSIVEANKERTRGAKP